MTLAGMVETIFAHPLMAVDATYKAGGTGTGISVRVIFARPDEVMDGLGETRLRGRSVRLDLQAAEVAAPVHGDTITVGATVYTLRGQPLADRERLTWQCEAST